MLSQWYLDSIWLTCFENDGGENPPPTPPPGAPPGGDDKDGEEGGEGDEEIKDQNHLNTVLKREKQKFRQEREKLIGQLEGVKKTARLTTEEKDALQKQIDDLKTANMSAAERAKQQREKAEREWGQKVADTEQQRDHWRTQYEGFRISNEIKDAALEAEALPVGIKAIEALLRPTTRLVEETDEDGNPKGTYTAKVRIQGTKDGKPAEFDFSVSEAVKYMKDLPDEYGYLFKGQANGGLGSGTGNQGKTRSVKDMDMNTYMEQRKKNPASLGL